MIRKMFSGHTVFLKNTVWQYCLQAIKYLLPLVTLPYLTRVLAPEGYAVVSYTTSFMAFAQVFVEYGFNLSGTRGIASSNDSDELNLITSSALQARMVLCVVVGVAVGVIAQFIPTLRDNMLYTLMAYVAACGRALAPDFLFQGKEQMGPLTIRYFLSKGTSTLLTFVLVRGTADLLLVPALDIIASTIALLWSFLSARKLFGIRLVAVPASRVLADIRNSTLYFVTNMSGSALNGLTTLFVGLAISSPTVIACWSLAMSTVNAVKQMYYPIVNSLYPHITKNQDFGFVKKILLLALPFVGVGTVLFVLLSDTFALVLGGEGYLPAAQIMVISAPNLFFTFFNVLLGWPVLGAMGRVASYTRNVLVSSGINLAVLVLITAFVPENIILFAISRDLAEILLFAMQIVAVRDAFRGAKQA